MGRRSKTSGTTSRRSTSRSSIRPAIRWRTSTCRSPGPTDGTLLLRSQTSTVQIRVMEKTPPPVRIISLGRVYRPDTADATHYPMFHQMEGLLVDEHVTMADLKSVLRMFAASYLGSDVHIRFRPSFFPFTEPSVEADFSWNDQWIEFGGAGMVDPNVLQAVGYDPEQVTGFAFGLGVERLCMRRHNITDIRDLLPERRSFPAPVLALQHCVRLCSVLMNDERRRTRECPTDEEGNHDNPRRSG